MNIVERFNEYAGAFEQTYEDDDWSRIAPYFTDDATYRSYYGADLEVTGRDGVMEQFRADVEAFDRRFDSRRLEFEDGPREEDGRVLSRWKVTYSKAELPDLVLTGTELAVFEGDCIALLEGAYAPETFGEFGAWLGKHGDFLHDE